MHGFNELGRARPREHTHTRTHTPTHTHAHTQFKANPRSGLRDELDVIKVRGPFVQTLCIEKDSYMDAI